MVICFQCGRPLVQAVTGKPVEGVERDYHGSKVKLHKCCAKTFDEDNRKLTAQERKQ